MLKPDLTICLNRELIVYEAKFTLDFTETQVQRTRNIADIWANVLFRDLGFSEPPSVSVLKLGMGKFRPDVS